MYEHLTHPVYIQCYGEFCVCRLWKKLKTKCVCSVDYHSTNIGHLVYIILKRRQNHQIRYRTQTKHAFQTKSVY